VKWKKKSCVIRAGSSEKARNSGNRKDTISQWTRWNLRNTTTTKKLNDIGLMMYVIFCGTISLKNIDGSQRINMISMDR
jgi:hypothetical protein